MQSFVKSTTQNRISILIVSLQPSRRVENKINSIKCLEIKILNNLDRKMEKTDKNGKQILDYFLFKNKHAEQL